MVKSFIYEPRHEKTFLRGFWPGKTQTSFAATEATFKFPIQKLEIIYYLGSEQKKVLITERMRRLICAFVVCIEQKQVFSWRSSYICIGIGFYFYIDWYFCLHAARATQPVRQKYVFFFIYDFYGPSRSFHSFWAKSIIRWGEYGRSPRKTTCPLGLSHVTQASHSREMTSNLEC